MGCRSIDPCRKEFFSLEILPFPSQYILSLLLFMIKKIGINLWSVLRYITLTLGDISIFTNLPWIWLNTKRECTVEVLRYCISFLLVLKYRLIIPRNLNIFYRNFYMKIPSFFRWIFWTSKNFYLFIYGLNLYLKVWHIKQRYIYVFFYSLTTNLVFVSVF